MAKQTKASDVRAQYGLALDSDEEILAAAEKILLRKMGPGSVSLYVLRHRAQQWLLRPMGVVAACLLVTALTLTGLPISKVHAHADGDHAHEHATQVFGDMASDHDDEPSPAVPTANTTLHSHDLGVAATALHALPVAMLDSWVPQALVSRVLLSPPSASPRTPPHRPPIA